MQKQHNKSTRVKKTNWLRLTIMFATATLYFVFRYYVYAVHFKCNKKLLREYPNLFNYTKDIFQIPGMDSTVNMNHIKQHYYGSHPSINPFGIVPHGPNIDYSSPHDRQRFSK